MKLRGFGDGDVDGASIGKVTYDFLVTPPDDDRFGEASGTIFGNVEALRDAFEAGSVVRIRRDDTGESIACFIMSLENGVFKAVVDGNPGQLH